MKFMGHGPRIRRGGKRNVPAKKVYTYMNAVRHKVHQIKVKKLLSYSSIDSRQIVCIFPIGYHVNAVFVFKHCGVLWVVVARRVFIRMI